MRLKELRQYLKEDKLVKHLTPNPAIDTGYFTDLVYKKESNCLAFVMKEEGEPLTTTKVREFIDACDSITGDTIPDDALITVDTPSLTKNNNNIVRWICESDTTIAINEKASEDVAEELNTRFADHLLLKGYRDSLEIERMVREYPLSEDDEEPEMETMNVFESEDLESEEQS